MANVGYDERALKGLAMAKLFSEAECVVIAARASGRTLAPPAVENDAVLSGESGQVRAAGGAPQFRFDVVSFSGDVMGSFDCVELADAFRESVWRAGCRIRPCFVFMVLVG